MNHPHPECTLERVRELEAEVARLRESLAGMETACEVAEKVYDTERAAHEQTRARVAELEAACANECSLRVQATDAAMAAESALASARTLLLEMAQSWRDEAFGGQHCSELRSNILEECASELSLYAETLAAHPTPGAEKGAGT